MAKTLHNVLVKILKVQKSISLDEIGASEYTTSEIIKNSNSVKKAVDLHTSKKRKIARTKPPFSLQKQFFFRPALIL